MSTESATVETAPASSEPSSEPSSMRTNDMGFEIETCGRCAGSGTYSWTSSWGSTCFKCGFRPHVPGRGYVLTKRGSAALHYYIGLLSKRADEVEVGDLVLVEGVPGIPGMSKSKWVRVTEIKPATCYLKPSSEGEGEYVPDDEKNAQAISIVPVITCPKSTMVRVGHTTEEKTAALAKAIEFQATLTKTGTVRKRASKKSKAE